MSVSSQLLLLFLLSPSLQGRLPCHLFWGIGNKGWHRPLSEEGRRLRLHICKLFFGLIMSLCEGSCSTRAATGAHVHTACRRIFWLRCGLLSHVSFSHIDGYFRIL